MKENDILNKINDIEFILNNNIEFEEYINEISNNQIENPVDLNVKIMKNIENKVKSKNVTKKQNLRFSNILKIVACTLFAIIIWETVFSSNVSYASHEKIQPSKIQVIYNKFSEKVSNKLEEINNFFKKPIERGK